MVNHTRPFNSTQRRRLITFNMKREGEGGLGRRECISKTPSHREKSIYPVSNRYGRLHKYFKIFKTQLGEVERKVKFTFLIGSKLILIESNPPPSPRLSHRLPPLPPDIFLQKSLIIIGFLPPPSPLTHRI